MTDIDLPVLHEGDEGHIEAHNAIRRILREHKARLDDQQGRLDALEALLGRVEEKPWLPEDPDNPARQPGIPEGPRQNPELPAQPSARGRKPRQG
jgi:hypothetical protein